ncbi:C-type lectin domain family 10 member A-like isoform X1 [Sander lucioperca]|uniref:C-type lectin domain family 10 member A-like isoform X1 n=1 Tax=Sander lucioperca TaxID=283035 RepID=UPI0016535371|nr:C-type lectin domain family 10 member A-like isoform X1 [Sander lucioperca]
MAEEEVNYASVVFKSNKHPPTQARKEEETVYDEVKVQSETNEPTADTNTGVLLDKKANNRRGQYQQLACCLGILCVILLLGIIAVVVVYHLATLSHQSDESELMAANRNLTNLNNKLSLDNEKLRRDNNNLTVQLGNLTQNYTVLESKITNLTADVKNLTTQNLQLNSRNQELETQRKNLTERIQDMETTWNKLNVSQVQWSIDAYCPKTNNVRQCKACQNGWILSGSNCYVIHDAAPADQKTWEEARQNCRGKSSDLVVVHSQEEQTALNAYSWGSSVTVGYWFGLRAEGGRWKWIDGSNLTESYWTPQPPPTATDGQCVMSVQNVGWRSVNCTEKQRWICIMKALSV